jgi:hypothetical protein
VPPHCSYSNTVWTTTSRKITRLSYARKSPPVQPYPCNFCKAPSALEKSAQANKFGTIKRYCRRRNHPRNSHRCRWLWRVETLRPPLIYLAAWRFDQPSFEKLLQLPLHLSILHTLALLRVTPCSKTSSSQISEIAEHSVSLWHGPCFNPDQRCGGRRTVAQRNRKRARQRKEADAQRNVTSANGTFPRASVGSCRESDWVESRFTFPANCFLPAWIGPLGATRSPRGPFSFLGPDDSPPRT